MASDESIDGTLREIYAGIREPLAPADVFDPVIEAYKKDVDFTLVERNLKLSTAQRAKQLVNAVEFIRKFRPLVAAANKEVIRDDHGL